MVKLHNWTKRAVFVALAAGAALFAAAYPAGAGTAPSLGTAESFAVLGGTTVTNTGPTTITGDIGVSPGSAITGSASITLTGATHAADAVALQAQNDVTTAYDALAGAPCTESFTGTAVELGGQTLIPGVYCFSSSAQLTGTLTLNGGGVYIFKTGSTLTTAADSAVSLIGGAQPCDVFWQIGSSADLFTNTTFVGSILALTSINLQNGASIDGRALARNGAVTMDTNTITRSSDCAASAPTTPALSPVAGLPDTGEGPPQGGSSPWLPALVAAVVGGVALGLGVRTYQGRVQRATKGRSP
jgi:Ice-binding-like